MHQRIGLLDYDLSWTSLNSKLRSSEDLSGGLSDALLELENHQRESGFIVDDFRGIQRFVFSHPTKDYSFRVQLNPKRARRHDGTGISQPPRNETFLNNGCFLCRQTGHRLALYSDFAVYNTLHNTLLCRRVIS